MHALINYAVISLYLLGSPVVDVTALFGGHVSQQTFARWPSHA